MACILTTKEIKNIALECYGLEIEEGCQPVELNSYEDKVYLIRGRVKNNTSVKDKRTVEQYVLKIYSKERAAQRELTETKLSVVKRCFQKCASHFQLALPMSPIGHSSTTALIEFKGDSVHFVETSKEKGSSDAIQNEENGLQDISNNKENGLPDTSKTYLVRLTNFIPGQIIDANTVGEELAFQCGKGAAILDEALMEDSIKPVEGKSNWEWNVLFLGEEFRQQYVNSLEDSDNQKLVNLVLDEYESFVKPKLSDLPWQWIHNDLADQNTVTNSNDLVGFIDMDEMVYSHRVVDLSVMLAYYTMMSTPERCLMLMRQLYRGYSSISPLSETELDILHNLTMCRYVQSLCIGHYMNKHVNPDNAYVVNTSKTGWKMFRHIFHIGKELFLGEIQK